MPVPAESTDGPMGAPSEREPQGPGSRDVTWDVMSAHIKDVVILADLSGTVFYASPSCRNLGYEQADLIGRSAADFFHPDDLEHANANVAALFAGTDRDQPVNREHRVRRKDGTWVWMEGNPSLLPNGAGGTVGFVNIFRDVTDRRATGEALAQLTQRAAMAEAVAGVGYWRFDAQTREFTCSEEMFRIYGRTPELEPRLDGGLSMVHPDDQAEAQARVTRALATGEGWSDAVARIVRLDGEIRHISGRGICERDAAGRVTAVFGTIMDVTEQRAARLTIEQSEARYRLITESATDMISQISCRDGRLTYLSPAVEKITGHSPAELLGQRMQALVHPEDRAEVMGAFRDLVSGARPEGRSIRFRSRHKDGSWLWLESNPRLVRGADGAPTDVIDVTRDVHEQQALKTRLRESVAEAEKLAAVKSEFLANMSHEIRTPLTAVLGFAALLSERRDLDPEVQGQLERIAGASRGLLALVNDVLDFSKLEAGEVIIRRRPVSSEQVAREVLEMFALQATAKGIDLRFDAAVDLPKRLLIDDDRLRQILINLVGNAVKFTERGRVSLSLTYDVTEGLIVDVADTGAGISASAQASLFQRFSQVDGSPTRSKGGTGLGLAICRGLAEAMGGAVTLTSRVGRGSTFRLVVPALRAAETHAVGASEEDLDLLCGLRVLVVDDNAVNRELVRAILEPAGVEVSEAVDGLAGVETARHVPFDAILMDLRMPGLDGRGAVAILRGEPGPNQHMPIIAFSAEDALDAEKARACGFQGVVRKPTSPGALLRALALVTDTALEAERVETAGGMLNVVAG